MSRKNSLLLICGFAFALLASSARAQDPVEIYEYEPYRVHIAYAFEAGVDVDDKLREYFLAEFQQQLKRTFQAAWRTSLAPMPQSMQPKIVRGLEGIGAKDLLQDDFVLAISSTQEATQSIRSTEIAIDVLSEIAISPSDLDAILAASGDMQDAPGLRDIVSKAKPAEFAVENVGEKIAAAIIRRSAAAELDPASTRVLQLYFPWQIGNFLRQHDKLFFLVVGKKGDDFFVKAKEIDCPMTFDGPMFASSFQAWTSGPRVASTVVTRAFAPVARIERSTRTTAELLLKAGGLILDPGNPAQVQVGDLLHPIIRKDDRNGVPVLLQAQPWTYAAISSVDREALKANVYSSGRSGLGGRANRRTQRVVLRVRPQLDATAIQIVVAKDGAPQTGCFIYERDLITDKFELIGRTDWRGQLSLPVPEDFGTFLPDDIKQKRFKAMREQRLAAEEDTEKPKNGSPEEPEATKEIAAGDPTGDDAPKEDYTNTTKWEIPLNAPLKQIYVKSGEFVMAKLFSIPGLHDKEVAELGDDRLRLEIEAFVKGYQNEVIELIGLRRLLAARVQLYVKKGKIDEAKAELNRLRSLKDYTQMADGLVNIRRRFLGDDQKDLPAYTRIKIDRMFATTRELLQKYLQDSLVDNAVQVIEDAEK